MTRVETAVLIFGACLVIAGVSLIDLRAGVIAVGVACILSAIDLRGTPR